MYCSIFFNSLMIFIYLFLFILAQSHTNVQTQLDRSFNIAIYFLSQRILCILCPINKRRKKKPPAFIIQLDNML